MLFHRLRIWLRRVTSSEALESAERLSRPDCLVEGLERRVLLSADAVAALADVELVEDGGGGVVDVSEGFADLEHPGTVIEFDTVPILVDDNGDRRADRTVEDFYAELFDGLVPGTVENFLDYVEDGDLDSSFIHRSIPGFVIQGGAFTEVDGEAPVESVPLDAPIVNEFARHAIVSGSNAEVAKDRTSVLLPEGTDLSNVSPGDRIRLIGRSDGLEDPSAPGDRDRLLDFFEITAVDDAADSVEVSPTPFRNTETDVEWFIVPDVNVAGTLSPPKQGGDPDCATSGFFVNLENNAPNLDIQNEGFAAFGRLLFDGLDVARAIADLPRINAGSPFDTLPTNTFGEFDLGDLVMIESVRVVEKLSFSIESNSNPDIVRAEIDEDGRVTLTPRANANGISTVRIRATDLGGASTVQAFDVSVLPVDDPVVAADDFAETHLESSVDIDVLANDSDVDGVLDPDTVTVLRNPTFGEVTEGPTAGTLRYTPNPEFIGQDTFTYAVANTDGQASAPATVTIDVSAGTVVGVAAGREQVRFEGAGASVRVILRGAGQATVTDVGGELVLTLEGTDARSNLLVTSRGKPVVIRELTADGPLRSILARGASLSGDMIIDGSVRMILLHSDLDTENTISIGAGLVAPQAVTIRIGQVSNLSITSLSSLGVVIVSEWLDKGGASDRIEAPSIRSLLVKGDRRNGIDGAFEASLDLDGSDGATYTLTTALVFGGSSGVDWDIDGGAIKIDIRGAVDDFDLDVDGALRLLRFGDVADADVDAGAIRILFAQRWLDGSLRADRVDVLTVLGDRRNDVSGDFGVDVEVGDGDADANAIKKALIRGRLLASDWVISGSVLTLFVGESDAGWTGSLDGSLRSFVALGDVAGTLRARSIFVITIRGDVTAGGFAAGYGLGPDGIPDTADDVLEGGEAAKITRLTILGEADAAVRFVAGVFPRVIIIDRQRVDAEDDDRFEITPE